MLSTLAFSSLLLSVASFSQTLPSQKALPAGTQIGIIVQPSQGKTTSSKAEQLFPPASTLKLVTTLAAKFELGDDFTFKTTLARHNDDIIVRFNGDPSFTSQDLSSLLQDSKITSIKGDIILDQSTFTGYEKGVGWPWDILGVCYSTVSSAITLNGNCVMASIYTNADGSTRVFTPKHQPVSVTTVAKAVTSEQQKEQYCDLDLSANINNQYQLSGCLAKQDKPLPLNFAVQNPFRYSAAVLKQLLVKNNIGFNGKIKLATEPQASGDILAEHQSKPLPVLLAHMLKRSDNLYANNLSKAIGAHYFKQAGSFRNGTEAIKRILKQQANIDLTGAILEDGSGLSRNNRVTPTQLLAVLNYIKAHDNELNIISLMPTSGINGTLQYRQSMRKDPVKGNIIAKSGSLFATHNMAGFVLDKNGKPSTTFVQLVTDYYPDPEQKGTPPLTTFERSFYQGMIEQVQGN
ncbi:serine-type D-Ala-D-Ala carboxypeptidase [Vibrio sp. S11_S32]|uniref:Serine-type D-Ala-D-Ala carboxypeptidase n=1 Tax=Vibrio algicola TaxID=2662262 RepID=A0A5Q0TIN0_9VIBR|nr:serine-type D-Ala-D-Ala carboxypeptidase [Vibrio sp. S11_S32]